jgi:glutamate dehydrogenase
VHDAALYRQIRDSLASYSRNSSENLEWLYANMHPYFFITMKEDMDAIVSLASALQNVISNRKIILTDQPKKLIAARLDLPGSLYGTLKSLQEREISCAELNHSCGHIPGVDEALEIQRFEFQRKTHEEIASGGKVTIPHGNKQAVFADMKRLYSEFDFRELDDTLRLQVELIKGRDSNGEPIA